MFQRRAKRWDIAEIATIVLNNCIKEVLQEISRKKPLFANRGEPHIDKALVDMAIEQPAWGQLRVSNELKKEGIIVSPGGRSIWLRKEKK